MSQIERDIKKWNTLSTKSFSLVPKKKTLSLYENDELIAKLSNPACRLLLELVKNNRQNITRDSLLNNVWRDYGFTASNSGLNNYISELRKTLNSLEANSKIITTIPKIGFRLDADIDLHQCDQKKSNTANGEVENNVTIDSPIFLQRGSRYCLTLITPLIAGVICTVAFIVWITTKKMTLSLLSSLVK